jgi:hypothetical protein
MPVAGGPPTSPDFSRSPATEASFGEHRRELESRHFFQASPLPSLHRCCTDHRTPSLATEHCRKSLPPPPHRGPITSVGPRPLLLSRRHPLAIPVPTTKVTWPTGRHRATTPTPRPWHGPVRPVAPLGQASKPRPWAKCGPHTVPVF